MFQTSTVEVLGEGNKPPMQLAVHTCGTGPLALLIHGFPLDHRMWLDVMNGPLSKRRTLCAIDLRGHGQSGACIDEVHTMERFADDIADVIQSISDQAVDVCGLSMGGYVALALHARRPHLVRSLVLSNTRAAADTEAQRTSRDTSIETVTIEGRTVIADAMLPKLLAASATEEQRARVRKMIEQQSVAAIVADLRGLQQRPDRQSDLPQFDHPTLVLVGDQDVITPPAEAKQMATAIPGATLKVITGTAHMSPLEDAAQWSAAVATLWQ